MCDARQKKKNARSGCPGRVMLPVSPSMQWSHYMDAPRPQRRSRILVLASVVFVFISAITVLQFLALPNLRRLHLQLGVSWFDAGFHGFYPTRSYVSFEHASPAPEIAHWSPKCSDQYTFLAPHGSSVEHEGPMILDPHGKLVWMTNLVTTAQDFRVQEYRGEKYLTFWHGTFVDGHGQGSYSMLDSSYIHRFEVMAVGNLDGDLHDFLITKNNTALVTVYDAKPADLSSIGGPASGFIYDGLFQEIDIATGNLLFEWRTSDHVPFNTSFEALAASGKDPTNAYDAYHINSIDKDHEGNYLLSARHTHSIIKIDGKTGKILWTLGGKLNDFKDASDGRATDFAWQHDARWHNNHTVTLFDNTAETFLDELTTSRGMAVDLDMSKRVATLRTTYMHPQDVRSTSQGNLQVLPETGNVFVSWGHCGAFTEFSPDGKVLCDTHLAPSNWFQLGRAYSYRVYKGDWVGKPKTIPAAAVVGNSVFVSWNGATEVAAWRLESWDGHDMEKMHFKPSKHVKKEDFETEIELPDLPSSYFRVVALDKKDKTIGVTKVLRKEIPWGVNDFWESCTILHSWGVMVSFFMLFCSLLLGVYWACRLYANRHRPCSEQYQLVSPWSTASEDTTSEDTPTRSLLWPFSRQRRVDSYDDG